MAVDFYRHFPEYIKKPHAVGIKHNFIRATMAADHSPTGEVAPELLFPV